MKLCPQCGGTYAAEDGFCPMDGARLSDAAARRPGAEISDAETLVGSILDRRYRLDEVVGEGGMAFVYRATHTLIGKALAVKVLRPEFVRDGDGVRRFLQEARLASSVKHPNVVDISDYGELPDGTAYYVMEYLRGTTLAARIHDAGALPPVEALAIALQICHGLDAAHEQSIIHRDLKPDNVFLCRDAKSKVDPRVKLLDFGIARGGPRRNTAVGAVLGTPSYMSPEQAQGQDVDARSDLYALGTILFEMLVGWVPFKNDDIAAVLFSQIHDVPPRIEVVKPALAPLKRTSELVAELLAKDPDDRPVSAVVVRERLSQALADLGDGGDIRLLRSTLALGSGTVDQGSGPDPLQRGKPWKERPIGWSRTQKPGAAVRKGAPFGATPAHGTPGPRLRGDRPAPARVEALDPTPIASQVRPGPKVGVLLTGAAVVAAATTLGVYSALVGFPTSVSDAASPATVTPAAPARAIPPQADDPVALGREAPGTHAPTPPPVSPPPDVEETGSDTDAIERPEVQKDRNHSVRRSSVKTPDLRRSKAKAAVPANHSPKPAQDTDSSDTDTQSKSPSVPAQPEPSADPAIADQPTDLKDPFLSN
jgi:eukaryotic-like serine/threonine-protein kinase